MSAMPMPKPKQIEVWLCFSGLLACAWFESDNAKMIRIKRYSHPQGDDDLSGQKNEPNSVWFRRNAVSAVGSCDSSLGRDELIHVHISSI
jgi:hypothetical protein